MGEMKESVDYVISMMEELSKHQPETLRHFKAFMGSTLKEGVLDAKTKELVAVGTAITARCKYCIAIHVEKALKAGATKEEIYEVAVVAILMGGGPAMTYIVEVQKAIEEFSSTGGKQ
ncbi:MAG: carboxymuconolactone decarboxylase family protein [Candidatus Thermoplasmatota archaeon]|nr:carboxymuconolactone decarboxylase family protein [Candidatus Thermoplasmatota archaeon]